MKNIIVTGSSRGLGLDLAGRLVKEGNNVAITARNAGVLQKRIAELQALNPKVEVIGELVELTDVASIQNFADMVYARWSEVDILVNNAGIYNEDRTTEDMAGNLQLMLTNNLLSVVRMSHPVIQKMKSAGAGHIINIVSISAKDLRREAASYSISKLALQGYTNMLRDELRSTGVKVTGVYPGAMNTSSWDETNVDRSHLIQTEEVIEALLQVLKSTPNTLTEEIVINNLGPI